MQCICLHLVYPVEDQLLFFAQAEQPYNLYSSKMFINLTEKIKMIYSRNMSNVKKHIVLQLVFIFFLSMLHAQPVNKVRAWLSQSSSSRSSFHDLLNEPLKKEEAKEITELLLADVNKSLRVALEPQWKNKAIIHDDDTLKFE